MSLSVKTVVCEYCKGYCRVLAKVENDRLVSCGEVYLVSDTFSFVAYKKL